jgi:hypothetical protein
LSRARSRRYVARNKAGIIFDGPNAELERKEDLWALF